MAEVLLFHHAQGLTAGVTAFADRLREAGHTVHTPDLYDGATFATLDEGVAHAKSIGFEVLVEHGAATAEPLSTDLVYAGFSLGVMPAMQLAVRRPGVRGALSFHGAADPEELGGPWPSGVPVQVHAAEHDPEFANGFDDAAARALVDCVDDAELFLYPGSEHLFADSSLPSYVPASATLLTERVLAFLDRV